MFLDVGMATRLRFDPNGGPFPYPDDCYPDIIADQRHFFRVETREQIEDAWLEFLGRRNLELRFDEQVSAVPYINHGRWLTDCPSCNAGNYAWADNPLCCCLDCGLLYKAAWRPPKECAEAVRLLAVRELVNQNWDAHKGETLDRLDFENRWYLGDATVQKNGVRMPARLVVPDELHGRDDRTI